MEFDFSVFDIHVFDDCWWFNVIDIDTGWFRGSLFALECSHGRWLVDVLYLRQLFLAWNRRV